MTVSIIRQATKQDDQAVERAALNFCRRHGITIDQGDSALLAVEYATSQDSPGYDQARHARLWVGCFCRALNVPRDRRVTMAYGQIGLSVD